MRCSSGLPLQDPQHAGSVDDKYVHTLWRAFLELSLQSVRSSLGMEHLDKMTRITIVLLWTSMVITTFSGVPLLGQTEKYDTFYFDQTESKRGFVCYYFVHSPKQNNFIN